MLEKSLEFYKTLLFCNILARRTRITQIELKQEINSVHHKLDAILSKIGQCPAVAIASVLVIGCPEEFSLAVGEMRVFEKLESTQLKCVQSQKKLVRHILFLQSCIKITKM